MNNTTRMALAMFFLFLSNFIFSQNFPYGINYQGVARDANGNAKTNTQVPVQFTIYQSSSTGTMVWQERQVRTTNSMGQFNAVIGTGAPVTPFNSGSFKLIDWGSDSTFLKVEVNSNVSFTGVFTQVGPTTKFQSVPYALYAVSANLKVPTIQRFLSGSGTYTTSPNVLYIRVKLVGGGGGGGGAPSTGGNGGATTFGTSLLIANGGSGGSGSTTGQGGSGGTTTVNSPATIVISMMGGSGGGATNAGSVSGGDGGSSIFGGEGGGGGSSNGGYNAAANSGSGGGGGGWNTGGLGAAGGGAGGGIEAIIVNPAATYTYTVGTGGTGASGTLSGGNGAAGIIIVEEYYK